MSSTPSSPRPHKLRLAAIILAVVAAILWGGYEWLLSTAQSKLKQRLADRGLSLQYTSESWSPWNGLSLSQAELHRLSPGHEPLFEKSQLHVDILWHEAWQARVPITRWQAKDATLTLHDTEGAVTLRHFTTDFVIREDKLDIAHLDTNDGTVIFELAGQIMTPAAQTKPGDEPFSLNLKPIRAVLTALNVKSGTGPLTLAGTFVFDLRPSPSLWNANLRATGRGVEWRGVPMQNTAVEAKLSQAEMKLACELKFAQGSAKIDITRQGWEGTPLTMSGTLTDAGGETDEFNGSHQGTNDTLTIARMAGKANLLELTENVPSLANKIPSTMKVKTFPEIIARDFVWHAAGQESAWTLASLQLRTAAAVAVMVRDKPLVVDHLTGSMSYDHKTWHFDGLKGQLLGGTFALDGSYDGKTLSKADVSLHSLQLAKLGPWMGGVRSSLDDSDLSLTYRGAICSEPARSTGSGTLELTHAPVVHLPLVDQAYELFPTLLPHEHGRGTGEFQVAFSMTKGTATIDPFKARSESLTVTATGTVDLNKRQVSGRARANLRGIAGLATAPLSHVLTEMQVSGPLDDVRVSPLSAGAAAKNLITGTVKGAT
ncbi:MAG: AsmA-like C-terminal region, partial [Verrucomicrobiaceae bacterium]|nr:AsmA-like C-terminal region [Verrucomicrobiaceae bacterium]